MPISEADGSACIRLRCASASIIMVGWNLGISVISSR
jgi:hypothetical protein